MFVSPAYRIKVHAGGEEGSVVAYYTEQEVERRWPEVYKAYLDQRDEGETISHFMNRRHDKSGLKLTHIIERFARTLERGS